MRDCGGWLVRWAFAVALTLVSGGLITSGSGASERSGPIQIGALTQSWGPTPPIVGLRDGLLELGYRENEHFVIGVRFTEGDMAALSAAARQLVNYGVDIIFASEANPAKAAQMATSQIPIVFAAGGGDPVKLGLVKSFARPGGNITGVTEQELEISQKRLEVFREIIPGFSPNWRSIVPATGKPDRNRAPRERREMMGLFKRGAVWWMSFTYRGKQVRKSTGSSDKRLAELILAKVKVKIVEGRFFDTLEEQTRTFAELMERYQSEHVVKKASQQTIRGYIQNLLPSFGHLTLAEISPKLIVHYKQKRYADGVAPATINRELAAMKKAFNLAIREWEWCRENPVSRVSMEQENNQRDRWLSLQEEERLLGVSPGWLREILLFALHTGMRLGEIVALSWSDVDLFRKTVTVVRSKNADRRTIPLNQTVLELLKAKGTVRPLNTDRVFYSRAQTPLEGNNLRRAFRSAVRRGRSRIFISTISGILLPRGSSRLVWICIRCSGSLGTDRRS